jgi:hypothetical protein
MKLKIIATVFCLTAITSVRCQIKDSSAIVNAAIEAFYELPSSTLINKSADSLAAHLKSRSWEIVANRFGQPYYRLRYTYSRKGYVTKVEHRSYTSKDSSKLLINRTSDYEVEFEYEFSARSLNDSDRFSFRTVVDELKINDSRYRFQCRFLLSSDYRADISINLNNRFLGTAKGIPLTVLSSIFGSDSNFVPEREDVDSTIVNDTLIHTRIYRPSPDRPKWLAMNYILLPSRRHLKYIGFKQTDSSGWEESGRLISRYDTLGRLTSRFDYDSPKPQPNIDSFVYYDDGKLRSRLQIRPNYHEDRVETIFLPNGLMLFEHWEGYYRSLNGPFGVPWPYCFSDVYYEYTSKDLLSKLTRYLDGKVIYVEEHKREFW